MEPRACVGAYSQAVVFETEQVVATRGASTCRQRKSSARKAGSLSGPDVA